MQNQKYILNLKNNIYVTPKFRFAIYVRISKYRNNYPKFTFQIGFKFVPKKFLSLKN